MAEQKFAEIDAWINHGFENKFIAELYKEDVKNIELVEIQRDEEGVRYSVLFRRFSDIEMPEGEEWQVKNYWDNTEAN